MQYRKLFEDIIECFIYKMDEKKRMKNATNVENTIFVEFEFLKHNMKMDERKRMWSKVLIKNLKIDIIITIKKKEVIF